MADSSTFSHLLLTPTFNRGGLMRSVCDKLNVEANRDDMRVRVVHIILDDGSSKGLSDYAAIDRVYGQKNGYARYQVVLIKNTQNNGVRGFWKTKNTLLSYTRSLHYAYAISMPDDCMPCDRFFERVTTHFKRLRDADERIVAMNIGCTLLRNWGTCRYVDEAYIATRQLFEALNFELEPIGHGNGSKWSDNFRCGSGTGNQMTQRLLKHPKYSIAPCQDISYLNPINTPSVMFKRKRGEQIWWRNNFCGNEHDE
jgi:hypothetical protein